MAAIFSAVGLVFMLTRIDFGSRNSGSASIEINERAIAELESIEAFIDPSDPEQGKEVADQSWSGRCQRPVCSSRFAAERFPTKHSCVN
ncbi:MAG: hypothetical protein R3B67_14315 [Phycisphaerales bacterium]